MNSKFNSPNKPRKQSDNVRQIDTLLDDDSCMKKIIAGIGYETNNKHLNHIYNARIEIEDYAFIRTIVYELIDNFSLLSSKSFENIDSIYDKYLFSDQVQKEILNRDMFERIVLRILMIESLNLIKSEDRNAIIYKKSNIDSSSVGMAFFSMRFISDCDIPCTTDVVVTKDEKFDNFSSLVNFALCNDNCDYRKQLAVAHAYGSLEYMFEYTRTNPFFNRGRSNIAFNYLNFVKFELAKVFDNISDQRIQIHELVGKSGIGKSRSVLSMKYLFHAIMPLFNLENIIYVRTNDYWWNGYRGQPIILYDDLTHITKGMKFDLAYELISIGSGTLRNPPMAFLKDTKFSSQLVYVTSNVPLLTKVQCTETRNALKRRIISSVWSPRDGFFNQTHKKFIFKGHLFDVLTNDSCESMFANLKFSFAIIEEDDSFDIEFIDFDDSKITIEVEQPSLTSSVPKSHSESAETNSAGGSTKKRKEKKSRRRH